MSYRRIPGRRFLQAQAAVLLCAGVLFAGAYMEEARAQGLSNILRGTVARPARESVTALARDPQRFRIRPKLVIDPERQEAAVTRLHFNPDRSLLLAVHGDGTARLWDLGKGVQLSGFAGRNVAAAAAVGTGGQAEIVSIRRDGSWDVQGLDGGRRPGGGRIRGLDATAEPVLSADGAVAAFRAVDGRWYAGEWGGERTALPDAARAALPVLAPDGSVVVYRAESGVMVAARRGGAGLSVLGFLDGCARGVEVSAGRFTLDGSRLALGDIQGNVCAWAFAGWAEPRRLFVISPPVRNSGPIKGLAVSRDGRRIAASVENGGIVVYAEGNSGRTWEVLATAKLNAATTRPLLLDAGRNWVLSGENAGRIGLHAIIEERQLERTAWLISTDNGWSILDPKGRFDGSQNGVDALAWSGESAGAQQDLPVDAFSERYYEPGLLAILRKPDRVQYLNENVDDLEEDGYLAPPEVTIDPVDSDGRRAGQQLVIIARLADPQYPREHLSGIRLYRNGKLVPGGEFSRAEGFARYAVRLGPGDNRFRARGVGFGGIESKLSEARVVAVSAPVDRPALRLVAIGVNNYFQPAWELFYARNDAKTIASALRSRGARLFQSVRADTLLDSSALKSTIRDGILGQGASAQDVLVVYFSGHGYALEEEHGWEWFLIPFSDAWKRGAATEGELDEMVRRHALSSRELMSILAQAEAQRVFLVLDACYSGAMVEALQTLSGPDRPSVDDAVAQKALQRVARVGGIHVLAASRAQELAGELLVEPHGALTFLVLEAMEGEADGAAGGGRDQRISVREIVEYVGQEMPNLARKLKQPPISQKPVGYSRGEDFEIAEF